MAAPSSVRYCASLQVGISDPSPLTQHLCSKMQSSSHCTRASRQMNQEGRPDHKKLGFLGRWSPPSKIPSAASVRHDSCTGDGSQCERTSSASSELPVGIDQQVSHDLMLRRIEQSLQRHHHQFIGIINSSSSSSSAAAAASSSSSSSSSSAAVLFLSK